MKLLYMGILFRFIFCVSDASFAAGSSIIPFQLSIGSKPMLHIGGLHDKNNINLLSGIQIQPTHNLLLGGILSPRNYENDLSLYYHVLIGYVPNWNLLKFSTNMIQIGMHRYRFDNNGNMRWFSFSVTEIAQIGKLNFNFCWNKLFTQKWERNTVMVSTKIKLFKDLYLQPGAITFFTPEFDYSSFFLMSINL